MPNAWAKPKPSRSSLSQLLSAPPQWLGMYEDFIAKNAGQVSQIESALRSLTYIIPGVYWCYAANLPVVALFALLLTLTE